MHSIAGGLRIAFVAVTAACTSEDQAPRQTPAAAPNVVRLTATEYAFRSPDTIPAGWTTFRLASLRGAAAVSPQPVRQAGRQ